MDKLVIKGGTPLKGHVKVSGAKNAVLPIMAATLLTGGVFQIRNVPELRDVKTMAHLLRIIGAKISFENNILTIDSSDCSFFEAPYELVKTMRASVYVLGPLVARFGQAKVSLPGGCAIGTRPVDLHIKGLIQLGAAIELDRGYINASAKKLRGCTIGFDTPSVGATGNLLMAATLADGQTVIDNAAKEPDIEALADFLVAMGADIRGAGSDRIVVRGVDRLEPTDYEVIPDRIEAGTFMIAGAISNGEVELQKTNPAHIFNLTNKLRESGARVEEGSNSIWVQGSSEIKATNVRTSEYPGFPTDLQAQWMAMMCLSDGSSVITDTIFFDRFMHAAELRRMGAQIEVKENTAFVTGVGKLDGAQVMSTDLRASACLVLAGLVAQGETEVHRVYHLDRGYEKIEEKLAGLGADIRREAGGL